MPVWKIPTISVNITERLSKTNSVTSSVNKIYGIIVTAAVRSWTKVVSIGDKFLTNLFIIITVL